MNIQKWDGWLEEYTALQAAFWMYPNSFQVEAKLYDIVLYIYEAESVSW